MISLSDNGETVIPAGLGYVQKQFDRGTEKLNQHDISLSLADFVMDKVTIGLTGHYLEQKLDVASYRQINGDLGLAYTPTSALGVALVAYNIFGEKDDIPEDLHQKTYLGAGFNYIYKQFVRFRVDATSESVYMAGVESYFNRWAIFRCGYQNNTEEKRQLWSLGAGFDGPRFGLNYAYQSNPEVASDYLHSVDLQIPF